MQGKRFVISAALLALAGCASAPVEPLRAEQLYAGSHCGREKPEPEARWIADADAYRQRFRQLDPSARRPPPAVRFAESIVVLVELGRKPTAGYGISLAEPTVKVDGGNAELRLHWQAPAPDAMSAQVITSPCVLVRLPRGDYSRVVVLDQQGQERLSAAP
jgi:hypothetical protein